MRRLTVLAALLLSGCYGALGIQGDAATQALNRVAALERRVDGHDTELRDRQRYLEQLGIDVHDDREVALRLMDKIETLRRELTKEQATTATDRASRPESQ